MIKTIFREKDWVNVCNDKYFTKSRPRDHIRTEYQYFCINPLNPNTTRADKNVAIFRNILIEMDDVPLKRQAQVLSELPILPTTIVYSGSKSLHAIWSLKGPISNEKDWRRYATALANFIEKNWEVQVDRACLNPSRLSRYPGYTRDNGNIQTLDYLGDRVDSNMFCIMVNAYLPDLEKDRIKSVKEPLRLLDGGIKYSMNGPVARLLIEGWSMDDGRKNLVFSAARELKGNGVELDTAIEFLEDKCDIRYDIFIHQVKSGFRY